jgi:hypothetical protein
MTYHKNDICQIFLSAILRRATEMCYVSRRLEGGVGEGEALKW